MKNCEMVNAFVDELLRNPDLVMECVALRLSATEYELKLLRADPLRHFVDEREPQQEFPFSVAQKGVDW